MCTQKLGGVSCENKTTDKFHDFLLKESDAEVDTPKTNNSRNIMESDKALGSSAGKCKQKM